MRSVASILSRSQSARRTWAVGPRFVSTATRHLLSTEEAAKLVGKPGVTFIDVRDPRLYGSGHIAGSVQMIEFFSYLATSTPQGVDHMKRTFEKLLRAKGITGEEHLVCYEDSLRGMYGASCRAWYVLRTLGHKNVQVLDGGWQKWAREQRPVTRGSEAQHKEGTFTATFDDAEWTNLESVKDIISGSAEGVKLLDVRDRVEWEGKSSSPYGVDFAPRKGRLPGAAWIEWYEFMEEAKEGDADEEDVDSESDGEEKRFDVAKFKAPEEIRQLMSSKGFNIDDKIVLYCFKGARASNTLCALKTAGFDNVSMYFGSWNEWSRDARLAINDAKIE